MAIEERDSFTGRETTGHEWNGIKELDTPIPRGVLMFLIVTHVWAIALWFFLPTWPLGTTYTKGLLAPTRSRPSRRASSTRGSSAPHGHRGWRRSPTMRSSPISS